MSYEQLKRAFKGNSGDLATYERFCAGSLAGLFSQSAIYPMEVSTVHLQYLTAIVDTLKYFLNVFFNENEHTNIVILAFFTSFA